MMIVIWATVTLNRYNESCQNQIITPLLNTLPPTEPKSAEHLAQSIADLERGKTITKDIDDNGAG